MEHINLNELRNRAYKTACEHGFHHKELSNEHLLCLVISELMEAVEADRKGKRADNVAIDTYELIQNIKFCKVIYDNTIKGSVEEELADACIRLLDLCGLRNIELENDCLDNEVLEEYSRIFIGKTFTESIFNITKNLINIDIVYSLIKIFGLAKHLGIDLLWHIEQKQIYNELRPMLNGKLY